MEETVKLKKAKKTRVIPGFKLTMGITVTMLSLIVLIPLASVMVYSLKLPPSEFIKLITKQNVVYAFTTSIVCSFIAAVINVIFGVILAWTLVKYDFPGKRILDGFIELPFALPTAVAGITLSKMYSDTGILGKPLAAIGIKVSYTHLGIIVAGIVLILFIKAILYGHKKMDERYLLLLLFVISRSIIESEHLTLVYSWFPALLGMAMFDSQKTKTEMRV